MWRAPLGLSSAIRAVAGSWGAFAVNARAVESGDHASAPIA
jgi:hypothetical protein